MWAVFVIVVGVCCISLDVWSEAISRRRKFGKRRLSEWRSTLPSTSFILIGLRDAFAWHPVVRITLTSLCTLLIVICVTSNGAALMALRRQMKQKRGT